MLSRKLLYALQILPFLVCVLAVCPEGDTPPACDPAEHPPVLIQGVDPINNFTKNSYSKDKLTCLLVPNSNQHHVLFMWESEPEGVDLCIIAMTNNTVLEKRCGAKEQSYCAKSDLGDAVFFICSNAPQSFNYWYKYEISEATINESSAVYHWCQETELAHKGDYPSVDTGGGGIITPPEETPKSSDPNKPEESSLVVVGVIFVLVAFGVIYCYYRHDKKHARDSARQFQLQDPESNVDEDYLDDQEAVDENDELGLRSDEVEMEMSALGKVGHALHHGGSGSNSLSSSGSSITSSSSSSNSSAPHQQDGGSDKIPIQEVRLSSEKDAAEG